MIFFTLDPLHFSDVDESNLDSANRGLSVEQLNQQIEIKGGYSRERSWVKSVLVLSAAGTWSLGFDAAREHATYNQSILPLIIAKR